MSMQLRSSGFGPGQTIPTRYTGEGQDISLPLTWSNLPPDTAELALIMDDPDAPQPQPWVHWVIYKLPPDANGLPEAVPQRRQLDQPPGALQGGNSFPSGSVGYRGPMPPKGHGTHHYRFTLYALAEPLDVRAGLDKPTLLEAMEGHILEQAELVGTYQR